MPQPALMVHPFAVGVGSAPPAVARVMAAKLSER
jgi:hypothetical protein